MIQFPCPCCGTPLTVGDDLQGGQVTCPKSGQLVVVPTASAQVPAFAAYGGDESADLGEMAQAFSGPESSAALSRPGRVETEAEQRRLRVEWTARGMMVGGATLLSTITVCIYAWTFDLISPFFCALIGSSLGVALGPMLSALQAMSGSGPRGPKRPTHSVALPLGQMALAVGGVLVGSILGAGSSVSFGGGTNINTAVSMVWAAVGAVLGVAPGAAWWVLAIKAPGRVPFFS